MTEHLALFAGYYEQPRDVDEVVELVGLDEKRDSRVRTLSGGQRRRLDLGLALVGDPELVFLDEPTTGFDPEARRRAWDTIGGLRELGKTILLTTHYLDEAERLSDRVAVLRDGEIVAIGPPARAHAALPATEIRFRRDGEEIVLQTEEPTRVLNELTAEALADGRELEGLEVRRASLEDVYLALTDREQSEAPRPRAERRAEALLRGAGSSRSSRSCSRSSSSCCSGRSTGTRTRSTATAAPTTC